MRSERRQGALRASGKAVWTWPPVVAVDAGPMQIQWWEGAALSRAESVLQGTTHDTVRADIGYDEKCGTCGNLIYSHASRHRDWYVCKSRTWPERAFPGEEVTCALHESIREARADRVGPRQYLLRPID